MWVVVTNQDEVPKDKSIIVEDENGWIGQAYFENGNWRLETFGQIRSDVYFDDIVRYFVIPD